MSRGKLRTTRSPLQLPGWKWEAVASKSNPANTEFFSYVIIMDHSGSQHPETHQEVIWALRLAACSEPMGSADWSKPDTKEFLISLVWFSPSSKTKRLKGNTRWHLGCHAILSSLWFKCFFSRQKIHDNIDNTSVLGIIGLVFLQSNPDHKQKFVILKIWDFY